MIMMMIMIILHLMIIMMIMIPIPAPPTLRCQRPSSPTRHWTSYVRCPRNIVSWCWWWLCWWLLDYNIDYDNYNGRSCPSYVRYPLRRWWWWSSQSQNLSDVPIVSVSYRLPGNREGVSSKCFSNFKPFFTSQEISFTLLQFWSFRWEDPVLPSLRETLSRLFAGLMMLMMTMMIYFDSNCQMEFMSRPGINPTISNNFSLSRPDSWPISKNKITR